jgi:hypothetical protein
MFREGLLSDPGGGGISKVFTFLTGRYGELRLVRKYDGDSPGRVGVAVFCAVFGEAVAEANALPLRDILPRFGIGLEYKFTFENGPMVVVTGVVCWVQVLDAGG